MKTHAMVPRLLTLAIAALVGVGGCARPQANHSVDPSNELPQGVVDGPTEGASVPLIVNAGGWAVDDRGVREVRLFVDGHFVNSSPLNTARPDVAKAFPQYARGNNMLGWTTVVEFPSPGLHTLLVQAVDTDGATRDIGTIKVNVTG